VFIVWIPLKVIDVGRDNVDTSTTRTATTTTTKEPCLTISEQDDAFVPQQNQPTQHDYDDQWTISSRSSSNSTLDADQQAALLQDTESEDDAMSEDDDKMSLDDLMPVDATMPDEATIPVTYERDAGEKWTPSSETLSGCNQQLFVPELVNLDRQNSRLTVEDIYIEAMTFDAEVRVFRRPLDAAGRRELSRIIDFCRDALRRKLILRSMEQAQGGPGPRRRSVSSQNLSIQPDITDSRHLELIAETAV